MLQLVLLMLVAAVSAGVVHDNTCPELRPVENFNLTAYQGTWYEVAKYINDGEKKLKCAMAEYKVDGDLVKVKNTHVLDGVQTSIEGTAKLTPDANNTGKIVVSLKFGDVTKDSQLSILTTDYDHYAIVFNCKFDEKKKTHQDYAWVMSRSKKLEGDAKRSVDNYIKNHAKDLDSTKFQQTDFSEEACKYNSSTVITEAPKP